VAVDRGRFRVPRGVPKHLGFFGEALAAVRALERLDAEVLVADVAADLVRVGVRLAAVRAARSRTSGRVREGLRESLEIGV
jgi:hypothetical protein